MVANWLQVNTALCPRLKAQGSRLELLAELVDAAARDECLNLLRVVSERRVFLGSRGAKDFRVVGHLLLEMLFQRGEHFFRLLTENAGFIR